MRRHLSYANVVATFARVFAKSGGALAANSYLINSTKQINPKVLKKLKGSTGKAGAKGATGPTGATGGAGPSGKESAPGKEGSRGKEGLQGEEGAPGTAVAYAAVEASGAIQVDSTPKNISVSNIENVEAGVYCFKDLSFQPNTAIVSADNAFSSNETVASVIVVTPGTLVSPCKEGENVRVRTVLSKTGALTNEP